MFAATAINGIKNITPIIVANMMNTRMIIIDGQSIKALKVRTFINYALTS